MYRTHDRTVVLTLVLLCPACRFMCLWRIMISVQCALVMTRVLRLSESFPHEIHFSMLNASDSHTFGCTSRHAPSCSRDSSTNMWRASIGLGTRECRCATSGETSSFFRHTGIWYGRMVSCSATCGHHTRAGATPSKGGRWSESGSIKASQTRQK